MASISLSLYKCLPRSLYRTLIRSRHYVILKVIVKLVNNHPVGTFEFWHLMEEEEEEEEEEETLFVNGIVTVSVV